MLANITSYPFNYSIVCWFMLAACLAFCGPGSKLKVASDPAVGGEMMCLRAEEHWYFLVSMMHPPKSQVSIAKWYDLGWFGGVPIFEKRAFNALRGNPSPDEFHDVLTTDAHPMWFFGTPAMSSLHPFQMFPDVQTFWESTSILSKIPAGKQT